MSNLPTWENASECYSQAYKLLEKWAREDNCKVVYRGYREGYGPTPSQKMKDLIDALNRGDEAKIKRTLKESIR